jgi:DNA (cytosine-5)-methyltransferase 1
MYDCDRTVHRSGSDDLHLPVHGGPCPSVISLFSGCGGSSTGYGMAGYHVLAAVEWESNAVATYRLNHPETLVLHRDIASVTGSELLEATGLQVGELDILDGSPPCQGFSTVGKRQLDDPRNQLFIEYVRLLKEIQPKVFVMENVSGLVKGKMKPVFVEILQTLKACGYRVKAKLMTASHYGVPQRRQRVIFIGVRNDLGVEPSHPQPFSGGIVLREALKGLVTPFEVLRPKGTALKLAQCLKAGEDGSDLRKRYGHKASDFSLQRLSWYKVAPTVCKTIRPGQCGLLHPDENRYLSTAELKRLCSFPDSYQFAGSLEEHWARMGNSVPPLLMKAIASHIKTNILGVL